MTEFVAELDWGQKDLPSNKQSIFGEKLCLDFHFYQRLSLSLVLQSYVQSQFFSFETLPRPDIQVEFEDPRVRMVSGIRPYRKGGIRMDRQVLASGRLFGTTMDMAEGDHPVLGFCARGVERCDG